MNKMDNSISQDKGEGVAEREERNKRHNPFDFPHRESSDYREEQRGSGASPGASPYDSVAIARLNRSSSTGATGFVGSTALHPVPVSSEQSSPSHQFDPLGFGDPTFVSSGYFPTRRNPDCKTSYDQKLNARLSSSKNPPVLTDRVPRENESNACFTPPITDSPLILADYTDGNGNIYDSVASKARLCIEFIAKPANEGYDVESYSNPLHNRLSIPSPETNHSRSSSDEELIDTRIESKGREASNGREESNQNRPPYALVRTVCTRPPFGSKGTQLSPGVDNKPDDSEFDAFVSSRDCDSEINQSSLLRHTATVSTVTTSCQPDQTQSHLVPAEANKMVATMPATNHTKTSKGAGSSPSKAGLRGVGQRSGVVGSECSSERLIPAGTQWERNSYGEFSPVNVTSKSYSGEDYYRRSMDATGGQHSAEDMNGGTDNQSGRRRLNHRLLPLRHCHKRKQGSLSDNVARKQLIAVVVLCVIFMTGEAVGGVLANSLALFTDVLHLGSDLVSFIISLLAMWLSSKPATKRMSFGYHRTEVLGARLSVFIIWLVSGVLCYIAVERIMEEHYKDVKPNEMLITASLGVVINFIMGFVLHSEVCCGHAHNHNSFGHGHSHGGHGHSHGGHGHSHNHGHNHSKPVSNHGYDYAEDKGLLDVPSSNSSSDDVNCATSTSVADDTHLCYTGGATGSEGMHGYQPLQQDVPGEHQLVNVVAQEHHIDGLNEEETTHQHKNINVRAAFIHVVGDIIQSIGVLVAALIIKFTDDPMFRLADPICTFLFSLLVLVTTATVLRDTLLVLVEAVPREVSVEGLIKDLRGLDGVVGVHSLHVWALTMNRNALATHLVIDNPNLHSQVLSSALALVQDRHHFYSATIQVELYDAVASRDCDECLEWL